MGLISAAPNAQDGGAVIEARPLRGRLKEGSFESETRISTRGLGQVRQGVPHIRHAKQEMAVRGMTWQAIQGDRRTT